MLGVPGFLRLCHQVVDLDGRHPDIVNRRSPSAQSEGDQVFARYPFVAGPPANADREICDDEHLHSEFVICEWNQLIENIG